MIRQAEPERDIKIQLRERLELPPLCLVVLLLCGSEGLGVVDSPVERVETLSEFEQVNGLSPSILLVPASFNYSLIIKLLKGYVRGD